MLGIGALYPFAVAIITRLLQLGIGLRAGVIASLLFIFLNFPQCRRDRRAPTAAGLLALPEPLLDRRRGPRRQPEHPLLRGGRRRYRRSQDPRVGRDLCRADGDPDLPEEPAPGQGWLHRSGNRAPGGLVVVRERAPIAATSP